MGFFVFLSLINFVGFAVGCGDGLLVGAILKKVGLLEGALVDGW